MATVGTWLNDELEMKFKIKALALNKTPSKLLKFLIEDFLSQANKKNIISDDITIELIKSNKSLTIIKKKTRGRLRIISNTLKEIEEYANTQRAVDISVIYKLDEIKKELEELKNDN